MDEQFSKWWEEVVKPFDGFGDDDLAAKVNRAAEEIARVTFAAAYSLGLAKGRKEGMEEGARIAEDLAIPFGKYDAGLAGIEIADAIRQAAQGGEGGE